MRRAVRRAALTLVGLAALAVLASLGVGEALTRPAGRNIGAPPTDLPVSPVTIDCAPRARCKRLAGWQLSGTPGRGAVLLLHGVRSDRRQMVDRARLLQQHGFAVLLVDLPAHGESSGDRITFGLHEGDGVKAALAHLRRTWPGERVGVIGVSLGAASLVLSHATPAPQAVVLESMYPTITDAVTDRLTMRVGATAAEALAPLLLWQLPVRLGVQVDELRPIDAIGALLSPVLILAGSEDRHTRLAESQRLFDAAPAPKAFWAVPGAAHVDLYAFAPEAYAARVLPFLEQALQTRTAATPP